MDGFQPLAYQVDGFQMSSTPPTTGGVAIPFRRRPMRRSLPDDELIAILNLQLSQITWEVDIDR
jgi:hypothetical protein